MAIILPMATEEYSISPSLSQRLHVNTLGLLSSDGQLQYGDAGTYMISSSQFQGALTLILTVSGRSLHELCSITDHTVLYSGGHTNSCSPLDEPKLSLSHTT